MTTMSEDPKEDLINYLISMKKSEIETILSSHNDNPRRFQSIGLAGAELFDISDLIFAQVMSQPEDWLARLDRLLYRAVERVHKQSPTRTGSVMKENLHLRLTDLPPLPEFRRSAVPRAEHHGDLIQVSPACIVPVEDLLT